MEKSYEETWTRWKEQNQGYDNGREGSEYDFEGDEEHVGDWSEEENEESERANEKDFEGNEENVGDWSMEEDALPDVEKEDDDGDAVSLDGTDDDVIIIA